MKASFTKKQPAYQRIKQQLRDSLGTTWPGGAKLPAITELASVLDAGHNNTHRAVRELAREGWLHSRPRVGTFVADVLPAAPRSVLRQSLAGGRSLSGRRVAVIHAANDPFLDAAVSALAERLAPTRARICVSSADPFQPQAAVDAHADDDAVVMINMAHSAEIRAREGQLLAVVSTERGQSVSMSGGYDFVGVNCEQGGFVAGEHARALGFRRAVFIGKAPRGGSKYDESSAMRLRGFELGLEAAVEPECRMCVRYKGAEQGAMAVQAYLAIKDRPSLIFAVADMVAIGFVHGALSQGLIPGRDFHIIGFDGKQQGRELMHGPLTTVEAPMTEMGDSAAQLLMRRAADPARTVRHISLGCRLFAGATTSCPRKESDA